MGEDKQSAVGNNGSLKHGIKVAFVSACHSEEIGNIFHRAGIPVVIAVNSKTEIMDKVCRLFASNFYQNLLDGETIRHSFENARNLVQVASEDFETCCCAHSHTDDCPWHQYYLQDAQKAHDIHSSNCSCGLSGVNGQRRHKKNCADFIKFKDFIRDQKEDQKKKKQDQGAAGGGGLANMVADFDDSDCMSDGYEVTMQ